MSQVRRARSRGDRLALSAALALAVSSSGTASSADPPKGSAPAQSTAPSTTASSAPTSQATASASAADQAKDKRERQARALEFHNEAKALYERGLYRRAIAKLEAAIELDPEGKELVYNLALIYEKLAEADFAEKYYLRYIEMEPDPKARERAAAIVKRLQGAKKNLKADIQERAAASGSSSSAASSAPVAAASGPVSRMPSPMVFVISGVAIAAAGVGIGFGVSALATHPGEATTSRTTTAYDLEMRAQSAHTQAIVADLSFMTSIVVGGAAMVLYLLETRGTRAAPPAPTSTVASGAPPAIPRLRVEALF